MDQINFSKYKGAILIGIVAAILIILAFYVVGRPGSKPVGSALSTPSAETPTSKPTPIIASSPISRASPISPISPLVSPIPNQLDPAEIETVLQQAIAQYENQNFDNALEILEQVLVLAPNNFLAYNARGTVYSDLKDYDQAVADYTKVVELEPLFPHAYYNRGRVYSILEKFDDALADLQKSIGLSPNEFGYRANGNIGLIYHQMGEYDQALEAFDQSISYNKENRADIYFYRGETYTALENYDAAIADYQAAIERFSNYDLAYQSLGYAQYKTEQFDQAIENLNRAIQISPNSPVAYLYLALVHVANNQLDQAEAEITQAINVLNTLPKKEQNAVLTRVVTNLESLSPNLSE